MNRVFHMFRTYWFILLLLFPIGQIEAKPNRSLTVNIFSRNNGVGLEADRNILKEVLESLGHKVYKRGFDVKPNNKDLSAHADINIFIERINPLWFDYAKSNWFIPNPEWYMQDLSFLERIDLFLCRTHEVERVFQEMGKPTYFTGFMSFDCYDNQIKKNFSHYLHAAGGSTSKGTRAVIESWRDNRSFPQLTVISRRYKIPFIEENFEWISDRVPDDQMKYLQNNCGIHLCPSLTEGFGHYIMEAMAVGAVVITTDAPPMNEFITDKRCLIPYQSTDKSYLATRYFVAAEDLEKTIDSLKLLSENELEEIGKKNRSIYLQKTLEFYLNFEKLLNKVR